MVYEYMIPVYAVLIQSGTYALNSQSNPKNLPIVPEEYATYVAEYLAKQIAEKSSISATAN